MAQALEKLKFLNEDTGEVFSVLFNPSQYSVDDASTWTDQQKIGQVPELIYTGGARKKLAMELFFDTYESKSDVREHTGKVAALLQYQREKHRPPVVTISWGTAPPGNVPHDFPFKGVLESLKQQFILFMSDGTPVRAKLNVSFVQFTLPVEELKKKEAHSADHTKTYMVKSGDTLSGIAGLFYNNPRKWRFIARENNITSPRQLEPGKMLAIPRIDPGAKD